MNIITDKNPIIAALNQAMRTLDPDRSDTAYDAAIDGPIMDRLLSSENFPMGAAQKIGAVQRDRVIMALRVLDRARRTSLEARRTGRPDPLRVSRVGMDWSHIEFDDGQKPALNLRMPLVLDGRWIGRDKGLLMDTASRALLDAAGLHIHTTPRDELGRRMRRAGAIARAMTSASTGTAYHVVLPSPFGPTEMRCHDSTGVPYASYTTPDVDGLRDLPQAYEIDMYADDARIMIQMRRARCFDGRAYDDRDDEAPEVDESTIEDILASMPQLAKPSPAPEKSLQDHPTDDDLADAYERHQASTTAYRRHRSSIEDAARRAADAVRTAGRAETERLDAEMAAAKIEIETIRTAISSRNPLVGRRIVVPAPPPKAFSRDKGERRGVVEVYAKGDPHSSSLPPEIGQLVLRITRADGMPGKGTIAIDRDVLPDGWRLED